MAHKGIKRSVQFVLVTFLITYSSWLSFMVVHFKTGVKVFDNSPFGLLMIIGLFSPSIVGLGMRIIEKPISKKIKKVSLLVYLPVSLILPFIFVVLDLGIAQCFNNFITPQFNIKTLVEVAQSIPSPLKTILSAFAMSIVFGGLEEIGWRGYLLPQLLKFQNPDKANMTVAILWSLWHLPLFFLPGAAQYQTNFIIFSMGMVTLSTLMTYVWIKTESILLAIVIHTTFNTMAALGFSGSNTWGQLVVSTAISLTAVTFLHKQKERIHVN